MNNPPNRLQGGPTCQDSKVPVVGEELIESLEGERAEEDDCWRDWVQENGGETPDGREERNGIEGEDSSP